MHPNPHFRNEGMQRNIAFLRDRAFGTLAINHENGPLISHIPFHLSEDAKKARLHLVRSNPITRNMGEGTEAVIAVTGSDSYVSPDWYGIEDQVPTWNYVAVHMRGKLHPLPHEELHKILDDLSASMETRLLPKKPWTSGKMDQAVYQKMLRQILPFEMEVSEIQGTWKLSQNKPDAVRLSAADHVKKHDVGIETSRISRLMKF